MMNRRAIYIAVALFLPAILSGCDDNTQEANKANNMAHAGHKEDEGEKHQEQKGQGEEHENEANNVTLTSKQIELAQIETSLVARGDVQVPLDLTGEVVLNRHRLALIVPRVSGYVARIEKTIGSAVKTGDTLALVESRELAEMKNAFLGAREKAPLALRRMRREEQLWKRKVSSEQDYQDARQEYLQANVELLTAEQSLLSVGIDLKAAAADSSGRYQIVTPISGVIIDWDIVQGQVVGSDTSVYTVADLSRPWIIATVNIKDIGRVRPGQQAIVRTRKSGVVLTGTVDWVADIVDEKTRTQQIRIEVEDTAGRLKPGMFVTASVFAETKPDVLVIPVSAVLRQKQNTIVFVDAGGGKFDRREIRTGLRDAKLIEVTDGLVEGDSVVTSGSFTLKSELEKSGFEAGHGH